MGWITREEIRLALEVHPEDIDLFRPAGVPTDVFLRELYPDRGVETLCEADRDLVCGYQQAKTEVQQQGRWNIGDFIATGDDQSGLDFSATAYADEPRRVAHRISVLTTDSTRIVLAYLRAWANLKPRTAEDWRRLWRGL